MGDQLSRLIFLHILYQSCANVARRSPGFDGAHSGVLGDLGVAFRSERGVPGSPPEAPGEAPGGDFGGIFAEGPGGTKKVIDADIHDDVMGSDHCPVSLTLKL